MTLGRAQSAGERAAPAGRAIPVRFACLAASLALTVVAAACVPSTLDLRKDAPKPEAAAPPPVTVPTPTPNANGERIGQGKVRIALLVPATAPGAGKTVATELRNGASMAMADFGMDTLELVVKDTGGEPERARTAAREAMSEGALAVLGPVFAPAVKAAAEEVGAVRRTLIAFSTDTSVARRGAYLLSYTPQADTARIAEAMAAGGKRQVVAFLPRSPESALRRPVLERAVTAGGGRLTVVDYDRTAGGLEAAIATAGDALASADALYVPEGGDAPAALLAALKTAGVDIAGRQIYGSGAWESANLGDPALEGAIYPSRDLSRFGDFSARYRAKFNADPGLFAALGYDAVTLSVDLVRRMGPEAAFQPVSVENPRGFSGINGVFRLRDSGVAERGLALQQVRGGRGVLMEPAPTLFPREASTSG